MHSTWRGVDKTLVIEQYHNCYILTGNKEMMFCFVCNLPRKSKRYHDSLWKFETQTISTLSSFVSKFECSKQTGLMTCVSLAWFKWKFYRYKKNQKNNTTIAFRVNRSRLLETFWFDKLFPDGYLSFPLLDWIETTKDGIYRTRKESFWFCKSRDQSLRSLLHEYKKSWNINR